LIIFSGYSNNWGVSDIFKIQIYPEVNIAQNREPNKLYAVPFVGLFVKFILLIPVFLLLLGLGIASFILSIINSFYVLFSDRYWEPAYEVNLMFMRYNTKMFFYLNGVTDKYPGFAYKEKDDSMVKISMPVKPNKLFAIPLFGFLARIILLIPFSIFNSVISYASRIGLVVYAWWSVLFNGVYPEAIYELTKDSQRLSLAQMSYYIGLSDNYPSFNISWNHKNLKVALIVAAVILLVLQLFNNKDNQKDKYQRDYGSYSFQDYK
jgi:hypothetical protein